MRRLAFLILIGGALALAAGCKGPSYPKDNPRLPKDISAQQSASTEGATGNVSADDAPASDAPAGDAPAGDTGGGDAG